MNSIWLRWMIVVFQLVVTLFYVEGAPFGEGTHLRKDLRFFPGRIGQWQGIPSEENNEMTFPNEMGHVSKKFLSEEGVEVYLYIGYLGKFEKGLNLFEGKAIAPGRNWSVTDGAVKEINLEGRGLKFNEAVFKKGRENVLMSYWYVLGERGIVSKETGRIKQAFNAMLNRRTDAALIKVYSRSLSPDGLNRHRDLHSGFIRELAPILPEFLPYDL